ncbi:MAG TPA: recombinase family protein [Streptosporangiaceae bacterium]|nr:recombinase family protein [Streptosporangiaceae bacterium]
MTTGIPCLQWTRHDQGAGTAPIQSDPMVIPGSTSSWTRPASRTRSPSRNRPAPPAASTPLQRPKFGELLTYARPGDTVHISEMFRLVRGTQHILDVLDVLHRDRLALRIHDGAFSAMDLTARHPRTGELLSTVKFMVQTLAAAGELQRELTYDGLRAAEAKGSKGGRRPFRSGGPAPAAGLLARAQLSITTDSRSGIPYTRPLKQPVTFG